MVMADTCSHPGLCAWQVMPWLSCTMALALENPLHGPTMMFSFTTPFPVVPFPSLVCPRHHSQAQVQLFPKTGVPLVLLEVRPWMDTVVHIGVTEMARSAQAAARALLARTATFRATCSYLLLPVLPWLEHWGNCLT